MDQPQSGHPNSEDAQQLAPKTYDGLTIEQWKERLKTLGPRVPGSVEAVVGLTEILADREAPPLMRRQAAMMLGRIGRPSVSAIPTLERLLSEPDYDSQTPAAWGAKALALLGPLAKDSTPQIVTTMLANESAWATRLACVEALAQIGGHHPTTIPVLIDLLQNSIEVETPDHQLELRRSAADAMMLIGAHASIAVPTLMGFLEHEDELLRAKAVGALGAIGPGALPAASAVAERLVFDDVDDVRKRAAIALGRFGPEVNEVLIVLSQDEEEEVRRLALSAIAEQTTLEPAVRTAILTALQDPEVSVRVEAAKASLRHQIFRSESLKASVDALFSKNRSASVSAAKLLEQLKPTRKEIEAEIDPQRLASNPRARDLILKVLRNPPVDNP